LAKGKKRKALKWIRVPQPAELVGEVEGVVAKHPELGYTGSPEFYRAAVREKIERIQTHKKPLEVPAQ
jgi:hypothetical protein